MGNSATKEQRPSPARLRSSDGQSLSSPPGSGPNSPSHPPSLEHPPSHQFYNVRAGRGSRPDLSTLLHIRSGPGPDVAMLEGRRESKHEREARKLEKERIARELERERSMREEHVDGGYLVTQGVYTGLEDYNKGVVRQLMIERRIAPFWRGLNDHSDSWTENQLVAAARGLPIPAPDEIPVEEDLGSASNAESETKAPTKNINNLTVPINSRSQSVNSDTSPSLSPTQWAFPPAAGAFPEPSSSSGSALFRGRAKTLASLTTSSKSPQGDLIPREMQLPKDLFVNGQPIEAYLYKDASECPICFLYYPPYLNKTRCCDQAICSECFVQIKRPDPHPPEHADPTAAPPPPTEVAIDPEELVSEPAACPFCVQPEFGITYDPPPFRRGLTYVNHASTHPLANSSSAMSSESSLVSAMSNGGRMSPTNVYRRRTTSVSAMSPSVITTDKVRPDWHQKLAAARAHTARRSAAATALHTAAYLMGNRGHDGDGRSLGAFGRRGILRRTSGGDGPAGNGSPQLNMLAVMSERYAASSAARGEDGEAPMTPGARGSSRRSRVDDLEDMMMMEAIRLSLASEEDRRKREEKEAKKEAKKKEKETKKREKVARKTGVYPSSANQSTAGTNDSLGEASASQGDLPPLSGKVKGIQQSGLDRGFEQASSSGLLSDPQEHLERARAQILPSDSAPFSSPYSSSPYRPSHLRTLSNASSTTSSIEGSAPGSLKSDIRGQGSSFDVSPNVSGINIPSAGSAQDTHISGTPPGGGAGMEPMFNFRSLAAMVGENDKSKGVDHEEDAGKGQASIYQGESSSDLDVQANRDDSPVHGVELQRKPDGNHKSDSSNMEVPSFKITASSRTNSGFDDRKHAAVGNENASRDDVQTSS